MIKLPIIINLENEIWFRLDLIMIKNQNVKQTSLKEGMVCGNYIWLEVFLPWFITFSWKETKSQSKPERRESNSEYQRASTLFKSRWLCNPCSQIFTWKVVYFRFFLVNEEFLKDDQKSRVSEFQSFFEEKSVLFC